MMRERLEWQPVCAPPRGLVRPVRIDPTGLRGPTRGQAAGPHFRRPVPGFFVAATVSDEVPEQRILEQSLLLPHGGAVTGWASLRLLRGNFFDGLERDGRTQRPVPLIAGPGQSRRPRHGVRWLQDRLAEEEVRTSHGVPHTVAQRALFDEMRALDVREAVVAMDMAAAAKITSINRMRASLDLAHERSRSPNETRTRLIWVLDARLPPPEPNQPVWDLQGRLLGWADLFDAEAGVVGEFDGADHRLAARHTRDVAREERFRRAGLEYFKVTGLDLRDPSRVVDRMLATRARAKWLGEADRQWTLASPDDVEEAPTTLDELLDERDFLRALHEQWERDVPRLPAQSVRTAGFRSSEAAIGTE